MSNPVATIELSPFGYPMTLAYTIEEECNPVLWPDAPHIGHSACLKEARVGGYDIINELSYSQIFFIESLINKKVNE